MTDVKDIAGENIGVLGRMNTGKTYLVKEMAAEIQRISGKRIIHYDHSENKSYDFVKNIIHIGDFENADQLPDNEEFRLVDCQDHQLFCELATLNAHNCIINWDDCQNFWRGGISDVQMRFITSVKNNGNDVFYQFHSFNALAPQLCESLHLVVIKEQAASEIPSKVPNHKSLNLLLEDVRAENDKRSINKQWAYRTYDMSSDEVFAEDKLGIVQVFSGKDYFKNRKR